MLLIYTRILLCPFSKLIFKESLSIILTCFSISFLELLLVSFLLWLFFAGIRIKIETRNQVSPQNANYNLNTASHNVDLVKPKVGLLLMALILSGILTIFIMASFSDEEFVIHARILSNILPSLVNMILFPIIVIWNNTAIYHYVTGWLG